MAFANRVTQLLGVDIPILQAPMGFIAKPTLVAAVSEAGAMGLVPGSSGIDEVRADVRRTRELTDKPFGVNLPLAFVKDPAIVDMIVEEGIRFVTTSAGSPTAHTPRLKEAGLTVFHVVPSLRGARKAIEAGVDGLVVEGSEGAGFKAPREVSSMVLLPLVASQVGVPVIAAGGIADGRSMAAAFALGAEGVQMGTRMVATRESPVHVRVAGAAPSRGLTAIPPWGGPPGLTRRRGRPAGSHPRWPGAAAPAGPRPGRTAPRCTGRRRGRG
ncbi:enoyl-[acyl-carrier protein] reductase II [Pseudonocardia oroxyli]|uniref:Enoyl-[acyl-carrier protein] reductase II n=1 Tax=Pseudonocardia oroxyli TaxID=366584 RepID=A0A1G7MRP6_PSEOR|nr:nitronate monooxygenase [Pseudonocardia oroxyli]SDF63779.1 enoyl-[acyl-carrier protein] reductase II [Pseudonocardia oroxyli]